MPLVDIGDRLVPFETCFNFRDIGGYETVDGRRVRWGSVFRSDTLHRLTTADLELASEIGIRTVIDLRSRGELERSGRLRPGPRGGVPSSPGRRGDPRGSPEP